jgi:hypothetical protein
MNEGRNGWSRFLLFHGLQLLHKDKEISRQIVAYRKYISDLLESSYLLANPRLALYESVY